MRIYVSSTQEKEQLASVALKCKLFPRNLGMDLTLRGTNGNKHC